MLDRPNYLPKNLATPALGYKWDHRTAIGMRDPDKLPKPLCQSIQTISYKASFALGLCCLEWIAWRLQDKIDITDLLQRLEAAWASTRDTRYARSLDFDDVRDEVVQQGNPDGLRQTALIHLDDLHFNFIQSRSAAQIEAMKCAHLAEYVIPKAADFSFWLAQTLAALKGAHPATEAFNLSVEHYDHSAEAAIPRAWFEQLTVPHDVHADRVAWDIFLRNLDPAANPYLAPADEMRAEGFTGEPYSFS